MIKRVSFKNKDIEVVGNIHLPLDFDQTSSYPAIVLATPGSSVRSRSERSTPNGSPHTGS
ncbi:hypothetical protein [Agrobacterium deltaense]|uniref:hypothetical protein n=1 Tax=Agrobacterium deltaense TaxID=1183412 RepID=UPI0009CF9159|nr:hypothetical protein [Agrobacterium deltaense]OOO28106.1 hypothetical protein BTE54_20530 [Agrobacterium sp. YIC 4121]CUX50957.1 hypothetical protein AGR7B_Lc60016 [Agrobacterium deltaense RV3]